MDDGQTYDQGTPTKWDNLWDNYLTSLFLGVIFLGWLVIPVLIIVGLVVQWLA